MWGLWSLRWRGLVATCPWFCNYYSIFVLHTDGLLVGALYLFKLVAVVTAYRAVLIR